MESSILSLLQGKDTQNASKHKNNAEYNRKQYPLSKSKKQNKGFSVVPKDRPKYVGGNALSV